VKEAPQLGCEVEKLLVNYRPWSQSMSFVPSVTALIILAATLTLPSSRDPSCAEPLLNANPRSPQQPTIQRAPINLNDPPKPNDAFRRH
jgi:hypothetical protein